jgi:hypothetical protein
MAPIRISAPGAKPASADSARIGIALAAPRITRASHRP